MPNLANAKKALRQSVKKAERNKVMKEELHSLRRKFRKLLENGKKDEAKVVVKVLDQKADKAAKKNVIKKNTASRIKSRLMKSLNNVK